MTDIVAAPEKQSQKHPQFYRAIKVSTNYRTTLVERRMTGPSFLVAGELFIAARLLTSVCLSS